MKLNKTNDIYGNESSFTPSGASSVSDYIPTAIAVGYYRTPLRGSRMKPTPHTVSAEALAAEQRPVVAHNASYGLNRSKAIQAPAGAEENRASQTHLPNYYRSPLRG